MVVVSRGVGLPVDAARHSRDGRNVVGMEFVAVIRRRNFLSFIAAAFLVFAPLPAVTAGVETLEIASSTGVHPFAVEIAQNEEERAKGLMFRKEMPEGKGMLFDFKVEQPVAFWMKNTYVSLDMIFIKADGRILSIAENTEPLSERGVPSGGPVRGVLEVVAGTAKKLGIKPGDRVAHRIFTGK
jgi:uncharacterized membrane protein (UPF0127 family)